MADKYQVFPGETSCIFLALLAAREMANSRPTAEWVQDESETSYYARK